MLRPCFPILLLTLFSLLLPGYGRGAERNQIDAGELRYLNPYDFPDDPLTTEWKKRVSPEGRMVLSDSSTGMEFVLVKGGCYQMGDTFGEGNGDEKPVHEVCVDDFYLGKYEVTINQFRKYLQESGNEDGVNWSNEDGVNWSNGDCPIRRNSSYSLTNNRFGKSGKQPMVEVSWEAAVQMASYLSEKTGRTYRLPTEAEWEYAAREGGKRVRFGTGKNTIGPDEANFDARSIWKESYSRSGKEGEQTVPVDSFAPNSLGLYNMSGNVWEWCQDWYGEYYYSSSPRQNPRGPASGDSRVVRGGGWLNYPRYVRAAVRGGVSPGRAYSSLGFRLVSSVQQQASR